MFFEMLTERPITSGSGEEWDGNNQMFPIVWAVVKKLTNASWSLSIEQIKCELCIRDGLELSLISDM